MSTRGCPAPGLLALLLLGCQASTPTEAASPKDCDCDCDCKEREVATGSAPTEFQRARLVGHYSTYDGGSGFIFDRTTDPPKARLDGTETAQVLTASGGPLHTTEYRSADGSLWIRVSESGDVLLFQGPKQQQGPDVVRDADADPL